MIRDLILEHLWRWHLVLPAILGASLAMAAIHQTRHLRAIERLRAEPLACFLRGLPALLPPALLLWLLHAGILPGRGACLLITLALAAFGTAVLARHIGERLHPDGLPWQQHVLGAVALGLLMVPPGIGIPLTIVLAHLGLGAAYGRRREG